MKHYKEIIILLLTTLCVTLTILTSHTRLTNSTLRNNISALTDSVEEYTMRNGNMMKEKQVLMLSNNELHQYLSISQSEIRDLQRKLDSKISYIAELESKIDIRDTLFCTDSIYIKDSIQHLMFSYEDEWLTLQGTNTPAHTTINKLIMYTPLTVGLSENNKVFVTSPNPYLSITDINGAVSVKQTRPKRWNVGVQVGVGFQYGLVSKRVDIGPYVGVGISYGFGF